MKILIAYDDSPFSQTVIDQILKEEWPKNTQFKVVMVLEPLCISSEDMDDREAEEVVSKIYKRRWQYATKKCEAVTKKLREAIPHCHAEFEVKEGSARKEIINMAVAWKAGKIILGAHGIGVCPRNILGSVSTYVAAHSPCSVEILRPTAS